MSQIPKAALRLEDFQYCLFPGENCAPEARAVHAQAYQLWKAVWKGAFNELGQSPKMTADNFSRQHEIGALFYQGECVALTFFHAVDFHEVTAREDSYFQFWTDDDIGKLLRDGQRVMICSNLTVSESYRGEIAEGVSLKMLILQLAIRRFMETDFPVATGAMRRARNAHKTALAIGATYLSTGVGLYDWDLDMVAWYRKELVTSPVMTQDLWAQAIWKRHQNFQNQNQKQVQQKNAA